MEIITHVLTNPQNLPDDRKGTARSNIDAAKKASNTTEGNLAGFDSNGELVDSGIGKDTVIQGVYRQIEGQAPEELPIDENGKVTVEIPAGVDVSGKADKVSRAVDGNFAGLDNEGNLADSGYHASDFATSAQGEKADTAYQKPVNGIPKSDLASDVQESLGKADTALQEHQDISGKANKSEMAITAVQGDNSKKNIQLKNDLSQNVVIEHQDVSGKANKSEMDITAVSGDSSKKNIQLKTGLSQDVVVAHQDISGKEDNSNKVSAWSETTTDEHYPSEKLVKGSLDQKEDKSNKVTAWANQPTDTSYPSEKLTKDSLDTKANKSEMSVATDGDQTTITLKEGTSATVINTHQNISGKAEKSEMAIDDVAGDNTKKKITLKSGLSQDVVVAHQDISGKADKVIPATSGNFAGLDSNGNLIDSTKNANSFATSEQGTKADSAVQSVKLGSSSSSELKDGTNVVIPNASTSSIGVVKLSNDIDSSSETVAATSNAVKAAFDALDAKLNARAIFFGSSAEWDAYKIAHPEGDPSKVYYVQTGTGADKYTVYVWKVVSGGTSYYEETDESSISLDGYWHDSPTIVSDTTNKTDTFVASVSKNNDDTVTVTTKVIQDVTASTSGVGGQHGLMLASDKEKLDNVESGSEVNIIESIKVDGTALPVDFTDRSVNVPLASATEDPNTHEISYTTGVISGQDKEHLDSIQNYVESTSVSSKTLTLHPKTGDDVTFSGELNQIDSIKYYGTVNPITPDNKTVILPYASYDSEHKTGAPGIMSVADKEKLDSLNIFEKVTIVDGSTNSDIVANGVKSAVTFTAGDNINLTRTPNTNEVVISSSCSTTVSAGRGISVTETETASNTDYTVSIDRAAGYIGSTKHIANVTSTPVDLLDPSATPYIDSANGRFKVVADQVTGDVYLYALKTVTADPQDPSVTAIDGVDVFTLSYNVQINRTVDHGFYGIAGVKVIRDSISELVLHSSTDSYPSLVGQCNLNGTATIINNSGTVTTIDDKPYYGYRLQYFGDVSHGHTSDGINDDVIEINARFAVIENMSGTAEYNGSSATYTGGTAIEIDNSNAISVKPGKGLAVNSTSNTLEVAVVANGGLKFTTDGSIQALELDNPTQEIVETVQELSSDMENKLTTNFPYPMITDVSYDFGALKVGSTCICQLFSVSFRHPIRVDETYIMVYAKDTGYQQSNVMFGIYEFNPYGNRGHGQTNFICDTGAVSIAKSTLRDVLEFPIKHVNSDPDFQDLRPDRMYYAVLAIPSNAGSGIFLASAPNYNAPVNSIPTLNWRMTNCDNITWNDPTNATLDETQVNWWDSGYNEHNSMNRFFMQIRNHVTQLNNGE